MSKFIRHDSCPSCGSKDNLAVYDDHVYCFGCEYTKKVGETISENAQEKPATTNIIGLPTKAARDITSRNIAKKAVEKYKVLVSVNPDNEIEAVFPRFDRDGNHIANQIRYKDKKFKCEGQINQAGVFGRQNFPAGGRSITITEGYYDTLASFEMNGFKYPVVGVMSASTAKKEIVDDFEYLNSFDEIVINFDNDVPGVKAAKECAQLFAPGKVRVLTLVDYKDANEYLINERQNDYKNEWFRASVFKPDGLLLGTELWGEIENHKTPFSVPYPWPALNEKTYGIRTSEMILLLADTGVGKTSVCKAIEHALLTNQELVDMKYGVGLLHFEEPKYDTAIGLMSIDMEKPLHLPDTPKTLEEMRVSYDKIINTKRLVIYDHFGSNDIDIVLAKIRHMAALGCKYIFLDHLTIIVSDQAGDERKQLDEISTKIKTMTMELDLAVFCVIHINRQGQVRGSAGPEQVANIIMRLDRDKKELNPWRRNVTKIIIEKNRFCGRTGPGCYLHYNDETGVLSELPPDLVVEFEQGGSNAGHEFDSYGR